MNIILFLADIGLVVRIGLIKPYTIAPYEFFICLASLLFIIGIFIYPSYKETIAKSKKYLYSLLIITMLFIIGSFFGFKSYGMPSEAVIPLIKDFFLLLTVYTGFLLHVHVAKNEKTRKNILYMMSIPILLFTPFLFFPILANNLHIVANGDSFVGLSGNQNILGSFLLIPFALSIHGFFSEQKKWIKVCALCLSIFSFSLLLWTGSRESWIASIIIVLYITYYFWKKSNKTFTYYVSYILLFFVVAGLSFSLLPHQAKIMVLDRVYPSITNYSVKPTVLLHTSVSSSLQHIAVKNAMPNVLAYQNRQHIWPEALSLSLHHPFGLGPEYARLSKSLTEPDGRWAPSHNVFLQTLLTGGWLLFLFFIFCIVFIVKLIISLPDDEEKIIFSSILIGFFITMQFNDFLFTLPWVWIVLGMLIAKINQVNPIS